MTIEAAGERRVMVAFATSRALSDHDGSLFRLDMKGADLSFLQTGRAPVLADHMHLVSQLLGVVELGWIEGDHAAAILRFGRSAAARGAWENIAAGVLCNVSMGWRHKAADVERLEDGTFHVRRWWPYEISLCTVPANIEAHARFDVSNAEALAILERKRGDIAAAEAAQRDAALRATEWTIWAAEAATIIAGNSGGCPADVKAVLHRLVVEHLAKLRGG
jgi:hypothetical protein